MRSLFAFALWFVAPLAFGLGDPDPVHPASKRPEAFYVFRTGERLERPYVASYHLFEYTLQYGRWLFPDLGYYDFGSVRSQLWFVGAGAELHPAHNVTWTQIVYVSQAAGPAAHNERALWIWPVINWNISRRLSWETVVYPTIPLNRSQRAGVDVDRTKVEWSFKPGLTAGAGYNATFTAGSQWTNRPFVTVTTTHHDRSWEFWLERIPGGAQVQLRCQFAHPGIF